MRIAICDDEPTYLEYLRKVIDKFGITINEIIHVDLFQNAEDMLFSINDTIPYDLLFLDIKMGNMNGMELAKNIRKIDFDVSIVFLTGVTDFVYDGYEVGAFRYLLKPIKEEQLYKILSDVKNKLALKVDQYLIVDINRESVKINYDDIIYIEALGHYVTINTTYNMFNKKYSMNDIAKELDNNIFIRVHRSFIVNLKHVEKINADNCSMSNSKSVRVSRRNYKNLNEAFIKYYRSIE